MWCKDLKFLAAVTTFENIYHLCKFSREHRVSLQNLRTNMNFSHEFGKFSHLFSKTIEILHFPFVLNKKKTKIIYIEIYAVFCYKN